MLRLIIKMIFYIAGLLPGLMPQFAIAQGLSPARELLRTNDIEYKKVIQATKDTLSLTLDVYRLSKIIQEKYPVIIFVHGGGFWQGDKRSDVYIKMATAFAVHGYASFSLNYRLKNKNLPYSPATLDSCISDVIAAVKWIRMNSVRFGIDTLKVFICGDSAGAGIVINTCYDSLYTRYFSGCIDLWGGLPGNKGWEAPVYTGVISEYTPPTCIIHGKRDRIIPYKTSLDLAGELAARKIYYELHPLKMADHYPVHLAGQFIPLMIGFTDKLLTGMKIKK